MCIKLMEQLRSKYMLKHSPGTRLDLVTAFQLPSVPSNRAGQALRPYAASFVMSLCLCAPTVAGAATHYVSPSQSLSNAVQQLQPGDTLILKGGTYRDAIKLPSRLWSASKPTTIMGAPGEEAVVKASNVVTGWTSKGDGVWAKSGWMTNSQQVFVNGQIMQQIGGTVFGNYPASGCNSRMYPCGGFVDQQPGEAWPGRVPQWPQAGGTADMTTNSFYYNQNTDTLYVKVPTSMNLNQQTVEVSVRPTLLSGTGVHGLVVQHIRFEHGNTSVARGGTIFLENSNNVTIDGIYSRYSDSKAVIIRGNNWTLRNSVIEYAGQGGLAGNGNNVSIHNNIIRNNNYRGFSAAWDSGGIKMVGDGGLTNLPKGLQNSDVYYNHVLNNKGPSTSGGTGLWCDYCDGSNKFHDNIVAYNGTHGIQMEVSPNNLVYNNRVFSNGIRGIFISGANNNAVWHNLATHNGNHADIAVQERSGYANPGGNSVRGNIAAWNKNSAIKDLMLPTNISTNTSNHNLFVEVNGFGFMKGPSTRYSTISAWRAAMGQDQNSWADTSKVPSSITNAINAKTVEVDWTPLYNLAKPYTVPSLSKLGVTLPASPPGPSFVAPVAGLSPPTGLKTVK